MRKTNVLILTVTCALICALALSACSRQAKLDDMAARIIEAGNMVGTYRSGLYLSDVMGFPEGSYEDIVVFKAQGELSSDCLIILKNYNDAARSAVDDVHGAAVSTWKDGITEQYEKVKNHVLTERSGYLFYVVSSDSEAVLRVIDSFFDS